MKNVTPDIKDILITRFISQLSTFRKFTEYWGTTYVHGVEVYTGKRYYYKTMDENMVKLAKMLGVYEDLKAKQEGVSSAWLHLNPALAYDSTVNWDKEIMVNNLNRAMQDLRKGTVVIGPSIHNGEMTSPPINTPVSNQEGLIAEIKAEYRSYWNSGFPVFTNQEDGFKALLLMYLLRSSQIPYTIEKVEKIEGYLTKPPSSTYIDYIRTTSSPAWRLHISLDLHIITANTDIVDMMIADLSSRSLLATKIAGNIFEAASTPYGPSFGGTNDANRLLYPSQPIAASTFWLAVPIAYVDIMSSPEYPVYHIYYEYYLKTSFFSDPSLSMEKKLDYLFSCIDSGYKEESGNLIDFFAGVVIIVAATYFAGPAGAAAASAFTSGAIAVVVLTAVTITVAAMYVAIAMYATSQLGAPNVTAALGTFMKTLNPLVKVASVISFMAGIATIVKEGYKIAAAKALEEGTKLTISSISIEIGKVALKQVITMGPKEELQTRHIIKGVDLAFGLYQKNELRSLEKSTENYRKELQHELSLMEQSQTSDILKEMQLTYPNVLTKDNSVYADRYDKPYEWWSTPYHTGNIQATTVNALWLTKD